MQLMPGTASSLKVSDSFDPYENIEGGVRHLRRLMDRYRGDLPLVLAAYNAGEQAVLVYRGVPPFPETRRYVSRILRRIGRADLIPRARGTSNAVVPVSTNAIDPGITLTVASSSRSGWAERQALERALSARPERSISTPAPVSAVGYADALRPPRPGQGP